MNRRFMLNDRVAFVTAAGAGIGRAGALAMAAEGAVVVVSDIDTDRAKALLASSQGISVRDAVHAAVMLNQDVREIATFDEGFDQIDGIERLHLS